MSEKVHDPIHRSSYTFRREGETLWVDTWLQDGGHLPEHFHPAYEEHWQSLDGTARVKLAGTSRRDPGPRGRPRPRGAERPPRAQEHQRPRDPPALRGDPRRASGGVPHRVRRAPRARGSTTAATCRPASGARCGWRISRSATATRPSSPLPRPPCSGSCCRAPADREHVAVERDAARPPGARIDLRAVSARRAPGAAPTARRSAGSRAAGPSISARSGDVVGVAAHGRACRSATDAGLEAAVSFSACARRASARR